MSQVLDKAQRDINRTRSFLEYAVRIEQEFLLKNDERRIRINRKNTKETGGDRAFIRRRKDRALSELKSRLTEETNNT